MDHLHIVILAAGKGTRMKSALPKVLHRAAGRPLIEHVLAAVAPLAPATTSVVVGYGAGEVREALRTHAGLECVVQEPQLGTGHALLQAEPALAGRAGTVLLLYGDVPLLSTGTLKRLVCHQRQAAPAATLLTAMLDEPFGYGRIIRRHDGTVDRIVEERDASEAERQIHEVNAGIYAFDLAPLFGALRRIGTGNAQGEYYLPDLVAIYGREGRRVEPLVVESADEIRGINSRQELAQVSKIIRQRKNDELMASGVTIEDPATTYIDESVVVGADTIIHPGVFLEGRTTIGAGCEIHGNVRIVDSSIGNGCTVRNFCVITGSHVADGAILGPFSHLRPESSVGDGAHVGNFVELKKTTLGARSKASHLAYLGDATIGSGVNVGAGTITCNYDGEKKNQTIIEDGAFIGSDTQLIAPVRVGRGAYVAAGSSITQDVPAGALGIARGQQVNKEGWVARKKGKK